MVEPGGAWPSIGAALAEARAGDTVEVRGGVWTESLRVTESVRLVGVDSPVIDGGGSGTVVVIEAPDVEFTGFIVKGSGSALDLENSAIAVEAPGVLVADNRIEDALFGIYLRRAGGAEVRGNTVIGKPIAVPRRGDGIRVWYSDDVVVEGNRVLGGRDVVLWYSERLTVVGNEVSKGRYGLHFMYCDDALIEGNLLLNNSVGTFMMYSRRLRLQNNTIAHSHGPSGYGIGLKDMDDAVVRDNLFVGNRIGIHLDNSPREVDSVGTVEGNLFAHNDIGVRLMPSVRRNGFSGNAFVGNGEQVLVAGGGGHAGHNWWTVDGVGNHWSDYAGYDADGDGTGDMPYRSDRLSESLMDSRPELRLFIGSPAARALDTAGRAFPLLRPRPKLVDDAPLVAPPPEPSGPAAPPADGGPLGAAAALLLALGLATTLQSRLHGRPFGGGG